MQLKMQSARYGVPLANVGKFDENKIVDVLALGGWASVRSVFLSQVPFMDVRVVFPLNQQHFSAGMFVDKKNVPHFRIKFPQGTFGRYGTGKALMILNALIGHELAHWLCKSNYNEFVAFVKTSKMSESVSHSIINSVDDARCERNFGKRFQGLNQDFFSLGYVALSEMKDLNTYSNPIEAFIEGLIQVKFSPRKMRGETNFPDVNKMLKTIARKLDTIVTWRESMKLARWIEDRVLELVNKYKASVPNAPIFNPVDEDIEEARKNSPPDPKDPCPTKGNKVDQKNSQQKKADQKDDRQGNENQKNDTRKDEKGQKEKSEEKDNKAGSDQPKDDQVEKDNDQPKESKDASENQPDGDDEEDDEKDDKENNDDGKDKAQDKNDDKDSSEGDDEKEEDEQDGASKEADNKQGDDDKEKEDVKDGSEKGDSDKEDDKEQTSEDSTPDNKDVKKDEQDGNDDNKDDREDDGEGGNCESEDDNDDSEKDDNEQGSSEKQDNDEKDSKESEEVDNESEKQGADKPSDDDQDNDNNEDDESEDDNDDSGQDGDSEDGEDDGESGKSDDSQDDQDSQGDSDNDDKQGNDGDKPASAKSDGKEDTSKDGNDQDADSDSEGLDGDNDNNGSDGNNDNGSNAKGGSPSEDDFDYNDDIEVDAADIEDQLDKMRKEADKNESSFNEYRTKMHPRADLTILARKAVQALNQGRRKTVDIK